MSAESVAAQMPEKVYNLLRQDSQVHVECLMGGPMASCQECSDKIMAAFDTVYAHLGGITEVTHVILQDMAEDIRRLQAQEVQG